MIQTKRIYGQDIEIKFGTEKCAMLIMEGGKRKTTLGTELPNEESIRTLEEKKITRTWEYWNRIPVKIKEKSKTRISQKNKETYRNNGLQKKISSKILGTIPKMDKRGTQTTELKE